MGNGNNGNGNSAMFEGFGEDGQNVITEKAGASANGNGPRDTFAGSEGRNFRDRNEEQQSQPVSSLASMFKRRSDTFNTGLGSDSVLTDAKNAMIDLLNVAKAELDFGNKTFQIIPIDRKLAGVHYSSIVLAVRIPDKKAIAYAVLMLTGTGRKELSINSILKSIPTVAEQRVTKKTIEDIEREIVLPVDTFDEEIYRPFVEEQIAIKFQQTENEDIYFINTFVANSEVQFVRPGENGSRVPTEEAIEIFSGVFNGLSYIANNKSDANDFSFVPIIEERKKGATLIATHSLANNSGKIRADLDVKLSVKFGSVNKVKSVNAQAGEQEIIQTSVYVAPIIGRRIVKDSGGRETMVNKISPVVVISNINGFENTLKYVLAGVVATTPMIDNTMYPYAIMNSKNNWGTLLAYEFGDTPDEAAIIDLKSQEYTEDSIISVIDSICGDTNGDMTAALAIDIPMSTFSHGLTILRKAADDDGSTAEAAGRKIVKSLNEMTGGRFPLDFDPLAIFSNCTVLPEGYFVSAKTSDKHSLQDIDVSKLIELNVKPELLMRANAAQASNIKVDSHLSIMEALSDVALGSAIADGKTIRAFFSPEFIGVLLKTLSDSGLMIYRDPLINRTSLGRFDELRMGYGRAKLGFVGTQSGFDGGPLRTPNQFRSARTNMF